MSNVKMSQPNYQKCISLQQRHQQHYQEFVANTVKGKAMNSAGNEIFANYKWTKNNNNRIETPSGSKNSAYDDPLLPRDRTLQGRKRKRRNYIVPLVHAVVGSWMYRKPFGIVPVVNSFSTRVTALGYISFNACSKSTAQEHQRRSCDIFRLGTYQNNVLAERYREDDDQDFMIFEEELLSASPEEKLLQSRHKDDKQRSYERNNNFNYFDEDKIVSHATRNQWNSETLLESPALYNGLNAETLSDEQALALDYIKQGHNIFITGVAGTGKSLVLKKALEFLSAKYPTGNRFVAVSPTGSTAIALEGQTLHSFAGIGIPKLAMDFAKSKSNKNTAKHWKRLQVLVLDEVSMVSGEFFDNLSRVVSEIRNDARPFGGIQLVVCGDFLQLSPIAPRKSEVEQMQIALQDKGMSRDEANDSLFLNRGFCFQSLAWREANFKVVELQEVFRQQNRAFVEVLQEIRSGKVSPYAMNFLKVHCERPLPPNDFGIRPTILHSKNVDVSRENQSDLRRLSGDTVVYPAEDEVVIEKGVGQWAKKPLENAAFFATCIAESELQLKIGAQVMLVKNMGRDSRLVNGSRGTVVGFRTVRKSPKDTTMYLLTGVTKYPVVQFVNGMQQVVLPQKFQSRLVGLGTCTRLAIPLRLAWAITTHKAQGLTLDYVIADVGQVFAEAQLYVALSRASDEKGLELRNFSVKRVRSNPVALQFHENPHREFPFWWEGPEGGAMPSAMLAPIKPPGRKQKPNVASHNGMSHGNKRPNVGTTDETLHNIGRNKSADARTPSPPDILALQYKTVAELKEILRDNGMKVSGKKQELIDRLTSR
jgi:ATP-dependent DNA helicase PIF1